MPFETRLCSNKQDFWLLLAHSWNFRIFSVASKIPSSYYRVAFYPFTNPNQPLVEILQRNRNSKYTF